MLRSVAIADLRRSFEDSKLTWMGVEEAIVRETNVLDETALTILQAYVFLVAGIAFSLGLVGLHRYVFDALDR